MRQQIKKSPLSLLLFAALGFNLSWIQGLFEQDPLQSQDLSSTYALDPIEISDISGTNIDASRIQGKAGVVPINDIPKDLKSFTLKTPERKHKYRVQRAHLVNMTEKDFKHYNKSRAQKLPSWALPEAQKKDTDTTSTSDKKTTKKYMLVKLTGQGIGKIGFGKKSDLDTEGTLCLTGCESSFLNSNSKNNSLEILVPVGKDESLLKPFERIMAFYNEDLKEALADSKKAYDKQKKKERKELKANIEKALKCKVDASFEKYDKDLKGNKKLIACLEQISELEIEDKKLREEYEEKIAKRVDGLYKELKKTLNRTAKAKPITTSKNAKALLEVVKNIDDSRFEMEDAVTSLNALLDRTKYTHQLKRYAFTLDKMDLFDPQRRDIQLQISRTAKKMKESNEEHFKHGFKDDDEGLDKYGEYTRYEAESMIDLSRYYQYTSCETYGMHRPQECYNNPKISSILNYFNSDSTSSRSHSNDRLRNTHLTQDQQQKPYGVDLTLTSQITGQRDDYLNGINLPLEYSQFGRTSAPANYSSTSGLNNNNTRPYTGAFSHNTRYPQVPSFNSGNSRAQQYSQGNLRFNAPHRNNGRPTQFQRNNRGQFQRQRNFRSHRF